MSECVSPLAPGTRIRFIRKIIEPADGDHPEFLLAREGHGGWIRRKSREPNDKWYSVYWDDWKSASFSAELGVDFVVDDSAKKKGGA